jgi:hypothetical protein
VLFAAVKVKMGRGFSPSTSVFPVSNVPPILHTHLQLHAVPALTNGRESRNLSSNAVSDLGKHWTGKYFRPVYKKVRLFLLHTGSGPKIYVY